MAPRASRIILTVNGPGELTGWAAPLTVALERADPNVFVGIAIVPCVYSAGNEHTVAAALPGVHAVSPSSATVRWILRGQVPSGFGGSGPTCVLYVGGDPLLALLLGKRAGAATAAYLERPISGMRWFDRLFARDEGVRQRTSTRAVVVGDLMVDAARLRCPNRRPPAEGEPPVIGILPGSRRQYYKHLLPFFLLVAARAHRRLPGARWLIARAPFVTDRDLAEAAGDATGRAIDGDSASYVPAAGGASACLVTDHGLRIELLDTAAVMAQINAALTLPGTNTAELAALGIPMVACTPSYKLDEVPLPGALGFLDRLPLLGKALKHGAVYVYGRSLKYLAHPNRRTRRRVVPEAIGRITADQVADLLVPLALGRDDRLPRELMSIMGPPGASDRLAAALLGRDGPRRS